MTILGKIRSALKLKPTEFIMIWAAAGGLFLEAARRNEGTQARS